MIIQVNDNKSTVYYGIGTHISSESYCLWSDNYNKQPFNLRFPIGKFSNDGANFQLVSGDFREQLGRVYLYQHGNHYIFLEKDKDGNLVGNLKVVGPGIIQSAVIKVGSKEKILEGKFPPNNELLLL